MKTVELRPGEVDLGQLRRIARGGAAVTLSADCRGRVDASAHTIAEIVERGETVYGVNTGFGRLARTSITGDKLAELQRNLVLSHSAGTGPLLGDDVTRTVVALKAASLARGHSGVRWTVIQALLALIQAGIFPCIPSKGSVGASGDLAPLAHLAAALIGVGDVRVDGRVIPAAEGLARAGLSPLVLAPKEGLALLNGTQVSTALALIGLFAAEDVFAAALITGSLSVDAALGSHTAFDARIQDVRGQPGQIRVADTYRRLMHGSEICASHADCKRVQDPYSLRCQPQVMGACLDHMRFAADVFAREANAVSDNPLVFPADGTVLTGGNFHAQPVAMASDVLALVLAEIGSISERRIALLMDKSMTDLAPFLAARGSTHSGFMIAHVTAAALASENKSLAHPASVDSLPTSANQEDHVSMATYAARRLADMADNTAGIIAIELLAASHGIELRAPLTTSETLTAVISELRKRVPRYDGDRFLAPDIAQAKSWIQDGALRVHVRELLPSAEE